MWASPSLAGGNRALWALRMPLEHLGTRAFPTYSRSRWLTKRSLATRLQTPRCEHASRRTSPDESGRRTVFAYVIGGKGLFCQQSDPYSYEAVGGNYFDTKRERLVGDGHLASFDDGDAMSVVAEAEPVRFLLISEKRSASPSPGTGPS